MTDPINLQGPAPTVTQTNPSFAPTLYLAGPISGRSDEDCNDWRSFVKAHWKGRCLDPMRRDARSKEMTPSLAEEIVAGDLWDIRRASAVLVHYDRPSVGTSMEIFYAAFVLVRPVFLINKSGAPIISPWLIHHTVAVYDDLTEATLADVAMRLAF
jgi:nucleoside 2-deoxyribosyltransferase